MSALVLLVEDNELGRDMLQRRLVRADYRVITAADGRAALAAIERETPDLVLLDMSLPVLDGWSTCREIRARPTIADVPVIALTAHAMGEDRECALEAGCDEYATKPVDFPRLLKKINRLLAKGAKR